MKRLYILLVVLIFIFCIAFSRGCTNDQERFKVLGTMGPSANSLYYRCLSECEKSDPAKQMSPSKGSMTCLAYCDSVITDLMRRGGPSYPNDLSVAGSIPRVILNIDDAYSRCGDGTHGQRCRSLVTTDYQINDKCRQDCEYSTLSAEQCMNQCSQSRSSAKSSGWSWK